MFVHAAQASNAHWFEMDICRWPRRPGLASQHPSRISCEELSPGGDVWELERNHPLDPSYKKVKQHVINIPSALDRVLKKHRTSLADFGGSMWLWLGHAMTCYDSMAKGLGLS